ncbi:MAG: alpha/beta hydrolase [Bordetella sp.]|jgi:magnesium chelatase accessory protein
MSRQPAYAKISMPDGLEAFDLQVQGCSWSGWRSAKQVVPGSPTQAASLHGSADVASQKRAPEYAQSPVVLLLHGTGGSRVSWRPVLNELLKSHSVGPSSQADLQLLVPDLPGHDATHCTRHSTHGLREMANDLQSLLQELEVQQVDLVVSHSAGAAVAIWLSLLGVPIKKILGVAPSLVPPPAFYNLMLGPLLTPLFVSGPSVSGLSALARGTRIVDGLIASTGSRIPEDQKEEYRRIFAQRSHVKGAIEFMAGTNLPALLERGHELQTQLSLLIAEDDRWIPASGLRRVARDHFPKADLQFCTGGHLVQEVSPGLVARAIQRLISK